MQKVGLTNPRKKTSGCAEIASYQTRPSPRTFEEKNDLIAYCFIMPLRKETIIVTGSSGFLGQHIVKLLQEEDPECGEIRLFDRRPYVNKLGHQETKPMKHFVADVRDRVALAEAFSGVDCVIHAAAVVDTTFFPNVDDMVSTNIEGTQNVIETCIQNNVPRLVFGSTTNMVCGSDHIFYASECTTPIPTSFMIGKYGETKCQAEKLILEASGKLLANGERTLRTISLRPVPLYGEQDKHFIYKILQYIKNNNSYYLRVRSLDERLQICYVGNAAWAHIRAKSRLAEDETVSGEAFFITDDTPIIDIHEHVQTYAEARHFKVSGFVFPYWLAWIILSLIYLFISFINVFVTFHVDFPNVNELNYLCSTFFFNRCKSTLRLDYQPMYNPEKAKDVALQYYKSVEL